MAKTKAPVQREITMAASLSGLTEEQAQEFQNQFKVGFQTWLAIALVAHVLVFAWRPWF
jgi:light-harvesting complex 1 beta chain